MGLGRFLARVLIGGLFVGHGTQKLFGWFGGPGPQGTERMMESLELRPARVTARLAGAAETLGGAMFAAGFLTPAAGAGLIGSMATAIRKVHWANGPWITQQGWEYNAVMIGAIVAIIDGGPGGLSVDHELGVDCTGHGWALAALASGFAGSTLVIEASKRYGEGWEPAPDFAAAEREQASAQGTRFGAQPSERAGSPGTEPST